MKNNMTEQKKSERLVFATINDELRDMDSRKEHCVCDIVKSLVGRFAVSSIGGYCYDFEHYAKLAIERIRSFAAERNVDEQIVEMAVRKIEYDVKYIDFVGNFYTNLSVEISLTEGELVDGEQNY